MDWLDVAHRIQTLEVILQLLGSYHPLHKDPLVKF